MSRIGKQPIPVPNGVKIEVKNGLFSAEGPKGKVTQKLDPYCPITVENGVITVSRTAEQGPARARHGLTRALLKNAVQGAAEGFVKQLEVVGVGYKADLRGREVHFALGYSHPIVFSIPAGIEIEIDKNNRITVRGADRQLVGQVSAEIHSLRPPDPYKAKGVRFANEVIRRKEGKAGGKR
jgi:large subunit ribosomal protein L6